MLWFRRKPGNRRLGREQVLDVKLRSSKLRAARARMCAVGLSSCFVLVFAAWLIWRGGEWLLDSYVYQNKMFALQELDISSDGVLSIEQLKRWTGVRLDENILALDLARVRRNLDIIPVVKSVSVQRIPPGTLRVRVIERVPVAQAAVLWPRQGGGVQSATFHIDAQGFVMLPLDRSQRRMEYALSPERLPLISGLKPHELQPGRRIDSPQLRGALAIIVAFDQSPMAGLADLKQLEVSSPDSIRATTATGTEVTFALTNAEQQLARWRVVHDEASRLNKTIVSLVLAVTNHIPVRLVDAAATAGPELKPLRTQNPRKKNV